MPIEIRINADTFPGAAPVADQINEAMAALGFVRASDMLARLITEQAPAGVYDGQVVNNDARPFSAEEVAEMEATLAQRAANAPKRERGQPSPGKARRTKAEIAEDEAAAKAEANALAEDGNTAEAEAVLEQAGISTGEERVGPEDDAATVEQDEADEAAETAAAVEERPSDKKLTHDDVRNSLGAYVKLYGMAAAQEDGPKVIALALKNPEIVKVSAIPETQEALGAVVAGIDEMTDKNPFKRAKVA